MNILENTSLMALLRVCTNDEHQKTESSPLMTEVMGERFSLSSYQHMLKRFFSFYASVEPMMKVFINSSGYHYTPKLPFLESDLNHMGCSLPLDDANFLPEHFLHDRASFLGVLYVLEGSTLGGSVIRNMLQKHIDVDRMATFFYPYGKSTRQNWEVTCAFIEHTAANESLPAHAICDAAIATFQSIRRALSDEYTLG